MQLSTMQDYPLTIRPILAARPHSARQQQGHHVHRRRVRRGDVRRGRRPRRSVGGRADQVGVEAGDRVGTFMWNNQTHLEAYLAVPCMGAVLHTLNIRLFPEQLAYVINHAEDKVIIVDASIIPLLAKVRDQLTTVKHIIVKGAGDTSALGDTLDYDTLLDAEKPASSIPSSTSAPAWRCATRAARPATPKG